MNNIEKETYCFDLDGTLCTLEVDHMPEGISKDYTQYDESKPIKERIDYVNSLYEQGHRIIIETARGRVSGKNWHDLTEEQLNRWGVKYHTLRTGVKQSADYYVDDKGINANDFFVK